MSENDNGVVLTLGPAAPTSLSPTLLVEQDGKWFCALPLLEFDPNAPELSPEQRRGVGEVQKLFERNAPKPARVVRLQRWDIAAQATTPSPSIGVVIGRPTPPPPPGPGGGSG